MILYLNEIEHFKNLEAVPLALRERTGVEMQQAWEREYNLKFLGYGPGWIQADISNSNRQLVMHFLENCGIAAIDVEARDIRVLWEGKKDPISLALVDAFFQSADTVNFLSRITPDEIFERLRQLAWKVMSSDGTLNGADAAVAARRMEDAGISLDPGGSHEFLEPTKEPPPTTANDDEFGLVPKPLDHDYFSAVESQPGLGGFLE